MPWTPNISVPDTAASDTIDALAARGGYRDATQDGPKPAFAKKHLIDYMKTVTRHWKAEQAAAVERERAYEEIDTALGGIT
jgi:hypothetical protein